MDDPGKLSKSEVKKFNAAYTSAVKSLQSPANGGVTTGRLPGGAKEITVYRNALRDGASIGSGLVHEGLHLLPQERNVVQWGGTSEKFQQDHQTPYNKAADELLQDGSK